jgi:hypothetical protein
LNSKYPWFVSSRGTSLNAGIYVILNAIIQFLISNRNIVVIEEERRANDPNPFFGLYKGYKAEREDIFSLLYSKFVMAEDLRHKKKHSEILKEY